MKLDHDEFGTFWAAYPRKTAKIDAMKAYVQARKLASAADILAGVQRYMAGKPDYADWCHPATFLNKGRWMDEYEDAKPIVERRRCPHSPRCNSQEWCQTRSAREAEGWQRDDATGQWTRTAS